MKSTFFAVVGLLCATLSAATPTATNPHVQARTCGKNQFYYSKKSCCLDNGGPKVIPKPPKDKDCPKNWYFHFGFDCCTPKFQPAPNPKPDCGTGLFKHWNIKNQCCEKNPPGGSPSPIPGAYQGAKSVWDNYKANKWPHIKKSRHSRVPNLCPGDLEACPIAGLAGEFECVDPNEDIRACGGCPAFGKGQDCTAIPFAVHVGCSTAPGPSCVVTSCEEGYQPSSDGKSCVAL